MLVPGCRVAHGAPRTSCRSPGETGGCWLTDCPHRCVWGSCSSGSSLPRSSAVQPFFLSFSPAKETGSALRTSAENLVSCESLHCCKEQRSGDEAIYRRCETFHWPLSEASVPCLLWGSWLSAPLLAAPLASYHPG